MSIPTAYCVELERDVTIEEAHEEYRGKGGGKRFNFSCADETCRSDNGTTPVISGVNYNRAAHELGRVIMHFRRTNPEGHRETCRYAENERLIEEIDRNPKFPSVRRLRASQLITKLDLTEPTLRARAPGATPDSTASSASTKGAATAEVLYARLCRSTRLYRVVDCYLLMSSRERIATPLTVGSLSTNYQDAFVYSENWRDYRHPQILRGLARFDLIDGRPTLSLHRQNKQNPVTRIRLTDQLLGTSRIARSYLQYASDVSKKSTYAIRLFATGTLDRLGGEIDFKVAHMNHLVVMERDAGK